MPDLVMPRCTQVLDAFEATFDLQLETTDQMIFTLTDGQVQLSGCKYVTYPEMCEPAP